jgi:hypothetical protein
MLWVRNPLRARCTIVCDQGIEIIYGRGKFVGDFDMGNIISANFTQIMLPI